MDNELTLAEIRERRRAREAERFPAEFEERELPDSKTRGDYLLQLILMQALLCALLTGTVFLLQKAAPAQFAQLRGAYHALMETDMAVKDIFAALKQSAAFVFAPMEDWFRAKPVNGEEGAADAADSASSGETKPAADTSESEPSGETETALPGGGDDIRSLAAQRQVSEETALPGGGDDIRSLAAQRQVSFVPIYLTAAPVLPAAGRISSRFGYRVHPVTGEEGIHTGLDIAAPTGTPIAAAFSGTVLRAERGETFGNYVRLQHSGGLETVYAHCSALYVAPGIHVRAGEIIALVGETGLTTGPHLHFELYADGLRRNPEWVLPPVQGESA